MFLYSIDHGIFVIVEAVNDNSLYLQSLEDLPGKNYEISSHTELES